MGKFDYCFMPTYVNETDEYYVINPALCTQESEEGIVKTVNAYGKF